MSSITWLVKLLAFWWRMCSGSIPDCNFKQAQKKKIHTVVLFPSLQESSSSCHDRFLQWHRYKVKIDIMTSVGSTHSVVWLKAFQITHEAPYLFPTPCFALRGRVSGQQSLKMTWSLEFTLEMNNHLQNLFVCLVVIQKCVHNNMLTCIQPPFFFLFLHCCTVLILFTVCEWSQLSYSRFSFFLFFFLHCLPSVVKYCWRMQCTRVIGH